MTVTFDQPHAGLTSVTYDSATQTFTYTAPATFTGSVTVNYTVDDGFGSPQSGYLSIDVYNNAPMISMDPISTTVHAGSSVSFNPSISDPDGDGFTIAITSFLAAGGLPAAGTLAYDPVSGNFTYTAPATIYGTRVDETFTYTVTDAFGAQAVGSGLVAVTNETPYLIADSLMLHAGSTGNISFWTEDLDGDALTVTATVTDPILSNVEVVGTNFVFAALDPTYNGSVQFTFTVADGHGGSTDGTITVTLTNEVPYPGGESVSVHGWSSNASTGTSLSGNVLLMAWDGDADALTTEVYANPGHGTVTVASNGDYNYSPAQGYVGSDSFEYQVNDGHGGSAIGTMWIDVTNSPPMTDWQNRTVHSGQSISIVVSLSDSDSDPLVVTITQPHAGLTSVTYDSATQTFTYTAPATFTGSVTVNYTVDDGFGSPQSGSLSIDVTNDAPMANSGYLYSFGEPVSIDLSTLASDMDYDALTYAVSGASMGSVSLSDSVATFTPSASMGSGSFTYTASDPLGASASNTVYVEVYGSYGMMRFGGFDGPSMLTSLSAPPYVLGQQSRVGATIIDDDSQIVYSDTRLVPGAAVTTTAGGTVTDRLLATFTDEDISRAEPHYAATLAWGDGTDPEPGVVLLVTPGHFEVHGTHTFARSGVFPITVTVSAKYFTNPDDPNPDEIVYRRDVETRLTAVVDPANPAPALVGIPIWVTAGDAIPGSGGRTVFATFAANPLDVDRYSAQVFLGTGQEAPGARVEVDPGTGGLVVTAPQNAYYGIPGTFVAWVVVFDIDGALMVATYTPVIAAHPNPERPLPDLIAYPVWLNEGDERGGTLLSQFTLDRDPEDMNARIDWGIGTDPDVVDLTVTGGVASVVAPTGTYPEPGVYGVTVTILDASTGAPVAMVGTTAVVSDLALVSSGPDAIERAPGFAGVGDYLIAAFDSADTGDAATGYEAWVRWGDGTSSAATVYGSAGHFWVGGDHAYENPGAYLAVVYVRDTRAPWQVREARTAVNVVDQAQGGGPGRRVVGVARVESADDLANVRGWTAWNGAGARTALNVPAVVAHGNGTLGSNEYVAPATYYAISPPLTDPEPGTDDAPGFVAPQTYSPANEIAKGGAAKSVAWPVRAADAPLSAVPVVPDDVSSAGVDVLDFTDPVPAASSDPWTGHEALIDYGDGIRMSGTVVRDLTDATLFHVLTSATHLYATPGDFQVSVLVTSTEAAPAGGVRRAATLLSSFILSVQEFRAYQRRDEVRDATWVAAGPSGAVSVNTGAVRLEHELDFDQSPGTSVGRDPHLVYNSATVNPRPVIEAVVPLTGVERGAGYQLRAVLTGLGTTFTRNFTLLESPSLQQVIALQPDDALATGAYKWTLTVTVVDGTGVLVDGTPEWTRSDVAQMVNNTQSRFGTGWALDLQWRLLPYRDVRGQLTGAMLIYGTGESRFFTAKNGTFTSPAGEFGTLTPAGAGFVYTSEFGETWAFDADGQLVRITDRNALATVFGYTAGILSSVTAIDGYTVTIDDISAGATSLVRFNESHGRTVALSHPLDPLMVPSVVTSITDADGINATTRAFTYTNGLAQDETWGTQVTHYRYLAAGRAYQFELGTGFNSVYQVQSASEWGFHSGQAWVSLVAAPFVGGVSDPRSNLTQYGVDPLGRSGLTVYADGASTRAARDNNGQVVTFTDERRFGTVYRYNKNGQMTRVARPDGSREGFGYNESGEVIWSTDGYDRKTVYTRDHMTGELLAVTDRLKNVTKYTYYDGARRGLVETVSDPRTSDVQTKYDYDAVRRLTQVTDAYGNKTGYIYEGATGYGNVTEVVDALGRETTAEYDGLNRIVRTTNVYGGASVWTYDAQGRVLTTTTPETVAGLMTTISEYDSRGLKTKTTEAAGTGLARTTWYDYDAAGNQTGEWDPREYDAPSGFVGPDEPFWTRTVAAYDGRNRITSVTEGAAYTAEDAIGPPDSGALARTTRTGYDKSGNIAWVETSPTYATRDTVGYGSYRDVYEYDAVGRVTKVTTGSQGKRNTTNPETGWDKTADGRTSTTKYDLNGNVQREIADEVITLTLFDALDRPKLVWEAFWTPVGRVTQTGYDKAGNVEWTTDGNGVKTVYGYDELNRRTSITEAFGTDVQRTTLFEYDAVGRVTMEWAPRVYKYTAPVALLDKTPSHIATKHVYNDTLRTETVTEAANLDVNYSSPSLSPLSELQKLPETITEYDKLGQVVLVTDPAGRATKTVYDDLGRVAEVYTNWTPPNDPNEKSYTNSVVRVYDAADNLRAETRAGQYFNFQFEEVTWQSVTDKYAYDVHNRLRWNSLATQPVDVAALTEPVVSVRRYDALDHLIEELDPRKTVTKYEYTAFGELKALWEGGTSSASADDLKALWDGNVNSASGGQNFLRKTQYEYDDSGDLELVTGDQFTRVNQDAKTDLPSVMTKYEYDDLGRKTAVTEAYGAKDKNGKSLARTTRYEYDGEDRLLKTIEPLKVTGKGDLAAARRSLNRVTRNEYDALGHVVSVTEADGASGWSRTTRMGYDAADNLVWEAVPRVYDFDPNLRNGDSFSVSSTLATVTVNVYDALNQKTSTTVAANASKRSLGHAPPVTSWAYDSVGRVVRVVSPADAGDPGTLLAVKYDYDNRNQRITTTEGRWDPTKPTADAKFVPIRKATNTYDGLGHLTKQVSGTLLASPGETDPGATFKREQETRFTYDALGRVRDKTEVIESVPFQTKEGVLKNLIVRGRFTHTDYDANGNPILVAVAGSPSKIDQPTEQQQIEFLNTRRTAYDYDKLNRLTTVTQAWAPAAGSPTDAELSIPEDPNSPPLTFQQLLQKNLGHASPQTQYKYDARDHVIEITDPRGVKSTMEYDALGRKVSEVDGSDQGNAKTDGFVARSQSFEYDPADRLTAVTSNNLWVANQQSAVGLPTNIAELGSVLTLFHYDPLDRMTREIDGAATSSQRETITTYDAADNVISVTTGYSPIQSVSTVINKTLVYSKPVTTLYFYDALGRTRRVEGGWNLTQSDLANLENLPQAPWERFDAPQFDAANFGHTRPWTETNYDASGHVTSVSTNVSNSAATDKISKTTFEYDKLGRLYSTNVGVSDTGGKAEVRRTTQLYDSSDAVVATIQVGGPWTWIEHDQLGAVTKQTTGLPDPRNVDFRAAVQAQKDLNWAGTLYTTFVRNDLGEVTKQADQTGDGGTVTTKYDLLGRVTSQVKKGWWDDLVYKYDLSGNLEQVTDTVYPYWYDTVDKKQETRGGDETTARTTTTSYAYDALNRQISETDTYYSATSTTGHTTRYWYDALGRVEAIWARDGNIRWFGYDALGRQVQEYWAKAGSPPKTGAPLNPLGNTNALAEATVIVTYADAADRVTYAFQATTRLQPDVRNGRVVFVKTVSAGAEDWKVSPYTWTQFDYDGLGRVKTEKTEGITLTYQDDAVGRVVGVSDGQNGWQTTEYDLAGRLDSRVVGFGKDTGGRASFDYYTGSWWRTDRVKTITYRNGTTVTAPVVIAGTVEYDGLDRETSRDWSIPGAGQAGYREFTTTDYYPVKPNAAPKGPGASPPEAQPNGLVAFEFRGGTSTITGWSSPGQTRYRYDKFNQVLQQDRYIFSVGSGIQWKNGDPTTRDAAGNGPYPSKETAEGTGNRTQNQSGYAVWYDHADEHLSIPTRSAGTEGNITQITYQPNPTQQSESSWEYEYDARNRLVSATRQTRGGVEGIRVVFTYDTFDRLVARNVTKIGKQVDPQEAFRYVYANGQPYADAVAKGTITVNYLFSPTGQPLVKLQVRALAAGPTPAPAFYLTDRQNSVLQIVDASANTLKRVTYSGLKATREGPQAADAYELGGRYIEQHTDLSMLSGQWFHPGLGRYLTEGGSGIGLNPYPVAENSPPNIAYVGKIDNGVNWVERHLGAAWNNPSKFGRGVVNGVTIGISEGGREIFFGADPSTWTADEHMAFDTGNAIGTVGSLFLGYGSWDGARSPPVGGWFGAYKPSVDRTPRPRRGAGSSRWQRACIATRTIRPLKRLRARLVWVPGS